MATTLGSTGFAQRNSRRLWLIIGALTAVVIALGWLSHLLVQQQVRHLVETNLTGTRKLITAVTHNWADAQVGIVERVGSRTRLQDDLLAVFAGDTSARTQTIAALNAVADSASSTWWAIVDAQGEVKLAADQNHTGRRLPAEIALKDVFAGHGRFSPALRLEHLGLPRPVFLACARLPLAGHEVALALAHDPAGTFSQLITQAEAGETMEAYAFDAHGRMLSESRFLDALKADMRVPTDTTSTIFTVELRDPGAPGTDATDPHAWPLTRMVADAVSGRDGIDLDGSRDYRGVTTVASWGWCPEHQVGIAVQLDHAEAYRALHHLTWLAVFLLGLVLAAGISAAIHLNRATSLRRRALHAEHAAQELGQYQLERKLGEGGMGAVYSATHRLMRRRTAVKLIRHHDDPDALARFEREVQLCCQLSHPNTIAIYDYGRTADGVFYYAMEHLDGLDLKTLVERHGPVPPGRAISILVQACGSLSEAHRAKLLHRDIKPANIFLTRRGGVSDFVKVLDFGLAKSLDKSSAALTRAGKVSGTPAYMAPETISQNPDLDGRVDLYALALVGVYLLTGRSPFERKTVMESAMAHLRHPLTSLAPFGQVPADLERVLLACVAIDPGARPADAEAMAAALMACADSGTWTPDDARTWWERHDQEKPDGGTVVDDPRLMPTVILPST